MNRARVAALLRELAAEFEREDSQENEVSHGASAEKPAATARAVERDTNAGPKPAAKKPPLTDLDKARARKALRRLGVPA